MPRDNKRPLIFHILNFPILQAVQTKKVTTSMSGVVKAMDSAMKSMNLEKISNLMDRFEKDFEDLDVQTSVMEGAMNQTTATNVPTDAVENLMKQAADEAGNDYYFFLQIISG